MTTQRSSPGQRVRHLLGLLEFRRDRMFYVPGLRRARALLAASATLTVFLVPGLGTWLTVGLSLTLLLLALRLLSGAERFLALVLYALPILVARLVPNGGWFLLLQPLVAVLGLASLIIQRHTLPFHLQLGRLRQALGEGWKAYLPLDSQAHDWARVLVSPQGQTFFLGVTFGRAVQQYGKPFVNWQGVTQETIRTLAGRDWGIASESQKVLWVVRPRRAQGEYPPAAEQGVTTVIATAADLAAHLEEWGQMRQNLADASPFELGRQVEAQAADELQTWLPPGWEMQRNLLLAVGGDADLLVTSPAGTRFAVDIKARTDYMELDAPRGERAKSWQEIHDQVARAARQLGALPVVWQPRTRDERYKQVGEVWCVRGAPDGLHEALEKIEGLVADP